MAEKRPVKRCPLCSSKFISSDLQDIIEHLAQGIISVYRELQTIDYEFGTDNPIPCPRCGQARMSSKVSRNALSRYADLQICNTCGIDEAVRDFAENVLPITSWWCMREVLSHTNPSEQTE